MAIKMHVSEGKVWETPWPQLPAAAVLQQGLQGGMELPKNEPLTVVMCCKATTGAVLQRLNLLVAPPSHFPNKGYTLWKTNIALENHHFFG